MLDRPVFNAWHADVANSSACDLIFRQALGLPAEVVSNSLLTWAGIAEVTAALRLAPGQTLVDLACGRGGYSREVARRTGARLIGLDFSAVAVTPSSSATRHWRPWASAAGSWLAEVGWPLPGGSRPGSPTSGCRSGAGG